MQLGSCVIVARGVGGHTVVFGFGQATGKLRTLHTGQRMDALRLGLQMP